MDKFIFIVGSVAAGKTIFMEKKLYNESENLCNFFDHDQPKLMVHLYASHKKEINDLSFRQAFSNAIKESIEKDKDFMMQIHFTNEQLSQINSYFHQYKNKFEFHAHFIAVDNLETLRDRANKRELLGGNSSEGKNIEKSFQRSFKNFITYLPKFKKATIWDNSKEFGFAEMQEQLVFEQRKLTYKNPEITDYSKKY